MAKVEAPPTELSRETLLEWYHQMVLIRRFEEKAAELYAQGKIGGFLHLYIGQEAVAVGSIGALTPDDHIVTAYRDHGQAIARGLDGRALMAELLGKATGVSKGKGGSMHFADRSRNFWGGYAIVGGHLPLACGIALAVQYREEPGVVLCFMGDGATNIGYFHEALNLAAVWKLPVIWVVENNQYGMGTAVERASAETSMAKKGAVYNIPTSSVDGMDALAMYAATHEAREHAASGNGPALIEALTYRFRGHSMGDPERYRSHDEVVKWQEDDPIGKFRQVLLQRDGITETELDRVDSETLAETAEQVRFAEESPEPDPSALTENVYVEPE
jgi:pyruvate dehydrogenase E1 component alpha subunit